MSRLRFVTARDLFEAYPIALDELNLEPSDEPSLDFMKSLASGDRLDQAIGFCAYLLPRREAVWWGCSCVKLLVPKRSNAENAGLQMAEKWVREPEEDRRLAALQFGNQNNQRLATTWLALAAGWSGGSMNPTIEGSPAAPPYQTARAVRVAVLMAGCRVGLAEKPELFRRCVEDGARLAEGEAS